MPAKLFTLLLLIIAMAPRVSAQDLKSLSQTQAPKLQKVLVENIQNFWLQKGLDRRHGGYVINFDNQGRVIEPYTKMVVTQSRQVWLHSRLARAGYKREENLEAAAWGFQFLTQKMWDAQSGGFFYTGPFNQPATNRTKVWWTEAEALVAALWMHRMTGEQKYLDVFARTWEFVEKNLIDWQHGEWHANITLKGEITGTKASIWKAGYHNGRAMIECLEALKTPTARVRR